MSGTVEPGYSKHSLVAANPCLLPPHELHEGHAPRDDPRVASVSGESCEGVLERRGSEVLFYDRGVHGHPPLGIRVGAGNSQTVESGPIRATRRAGVYRSARQRVKISHQLKI